MSLFSRTHLKDIVFSIPFIKKYYTRNRIKNGDLISIEKIDEILDRAEKIIIEGDYRHLKVGLVKDGHEYSGFVKSRAYYPKYERFLKNNNIKYEYYDIFRSDWQEVAKKFNVVIWQVDSDVSTQNIATNKIYVLEKLMGIKCLPSFHEIWSFEDKVNAHYLYKHFELPEIPTFVTHSKEDALKYAKDVTYPIISKLDTGSSSYGVEKLNNFGESKKLINAVFSYKGGKTYFPYSRQKDYVIFQEFVSDAKFDLRIMVIGDKLLGYYRYPNKGDFRASGAGNYEKKEIDVRALELAYKVKNLYKAEFLATDLLYSEKEDKYYIIESSIFIGVDTPEQLKIDDVAGFYKRDSELKYSFHKGKIWVQELTLKEFFSMMK